MPETSPNDPTSILVEEILKEKRSNRRWKNFRFIAWFSLICFVIAASFGYIGDDKTTTINNGSDKYVALVRLSGMIAPGRGFSAEEVIPTLSDAFKDKHAAGVIIDINSPGGTPVQSSIIHDAIITFKNKYHKKVIIVGEDLLTSGAYFIAVAGDKIYVNPNTITGSVGVIMKGFGFVEAMKKIGIERRVYTAGSEKDRLDPFLPQNADDSVKVQEVMGEVHQNFEKAVLEGRKGKLTADPATLFNGDFWAGSTAVKLGLVDGLGNLMDVSQSEFKTTNFKEYGGSNSIFKMLGNQISSAVDLVMYSAPM